MIDGLNYANSTLFFAFVQLSDFGLNLYVEQIFPLMTKMRESTYAVTMMDHEEEQGLFIMKQVKTLLKNLDFEYEFGKIISDKK